MEFVPGKDHSFQLMKLIDEAVKLYIMVGFGHPCDEITKFQIAM